MEIYVTDDEWANKREPKERIEHICPICKGNMELLFECVGKAKREGLPSIDANIRRYYCNQCKMPIMIVEHPPFPVSQYKRETIPFLVRSKE